MGRKNKTPKPDALISKMIADGRLALYEHPDGNRRVLAFFDRPLFREDGSRPSHITHAWWRDKQDMMISYLVDVMGWVFCVNQTRMHRVNHSELKKSCQRYVEFWGSG